MKICIARVLTYWTGRAHLALPCAVLSVLLNTPAHAAERQTLRGHVPAAVARLAPVDQLPGSQRMNLAIGLPLRNQEALTKLLQQIYDPGSPQYRQYLTPEQFTEKFGPTEQDYQAVIAFAQSNGLSVTHTHANRVLLDVNGGPIQFATLGLREGDLGLVHPENTGLRLFLHLDARDLAAPAL